MSERELHDLDREVGELKVSLKVLIADFQREREENFQRWDKLEKRGFYLVATLVVTLLERFFSLVVGY